MQLMHFITPLYTYSAMYYRYVLFIFVFVQLFIFSNVVFAVMEVVVGI